MVVVVHLCCLDVRKVTCISNRQKVSCVKVIIMAARRLCWPPAILFYRSSLDLSFFIFAPSSSSSLGRSSPNFATCSTVTQIYKIRSEIWVAPPPPKFGGPKTSKFRRYFAQFAQLDLFANISGMQQDIVNHKTALQDGYSRTGKLNCRPTLVHKRRKMRAEF